MRGLSHDFRDQILRRLQLKFVDHYPEDPYRFEDICDAAQFVLHGTSTSVSNPATPYEAPVSAMRAGHCTSDRNVASQIAQYHTSDRNVTTSQDPRCHFCGLTGHFIRQCPDVLDYIRLGRCTRNAVGKITLPSGYFVSREIPGEFLKYRIDEWHRRNPGHVASDTYTLRTSDFVASHRSLRVSSPSPSTVPPTAETSDLRLPAADRIKAIQSELNQLRNRTSFASITSNLPHRTSQLDRNIGIATAPSSPSEILRTTSDTSPPPSHIPSHYVEPICDPRLRSDHLSRPTTSRVASQLNILPPHHYNVRRNNSDHCSADILRSLSHV